MAIRIYPLKTPRHGIEINFVPTVKGSVYGGSIGRYSNNEYAAILDCVYEMADAISTSNGVSPITAVKQVCQDEGWTVLPTHQDLIAILLEDARDDH